VKHGKGWKDLTNPIPEWAEHGADRGSIRYGVAENIDTPNPEPGEIARGYATFDDWFAEVPSQTFTNRSIFNAATAAGLVVNAPYKSFPNHNSAETLFERLESKGLTWKVCVDPPSLASFTGLIHGARLKDRFATNFVTTDDPGCGGGQPSDLLVHRAEPVAQPQRHACTVVNDVHDHVGDRDDARTLGAWQAVHWAGRDRPRPRPVADPRQATRARGLACVCAQRVPDLDG
jgi:Phosphoesterase family